MGPFLCFRCLGQKWWTGFLLSRQTHRRSRRIVNLVPCVVGKAGCRWLNVYQPCTKLGRGYSANLAVAQGGATITRVIGACCTGDNMPTAGGNAELKYTLFASILSCHADCCSPHVAFLFLRREAQIHPSSSLWRRNPPAKCVVFTELLSTSRDVSVYAPAPL